MKKILFVCTGNTCRSPMAEAIFNKIAKEKNIPARALSAGLMADGSLLSKGAKNALEEYGIAGFSHKSASLSKELADSSDIIVGITGRHASSVIANFPEYAEKVFSFPSDIPDPYGGNDLVYKNTLSEIISGVNLIISELFGEENGNKNSEA